MASAWNRIGVNWGDLSNVRLEPVINELYKAVLERDYWIRVTGRELGVLPVDVKKYNTSYQLRTIYTLMEKWFRPQTLKTSTTILDFNESVYIYNDGVATNYPILISNRELNFNSMYGKGSVDYTSAGVLSSLVGFDMSFLGQEPPNGRVNLDHLRSFYKVLNLDLKNRLFTCDINSSRFRSVSSRTDDFLRELVNNGESNGTESEVISEFNSEIIPSDVFSGGFYTSYKLNASRSNTVDEEYGTDFQQRFYMFKDYEITDFNIDSYVYGKEEIDDGFSMSYTPSAPYNDIVSNNFVSVNWTDNNITQQVNAFLPYIPTQISSMNGDDVFDGIEITFNSQNFIDINNSALIEYYTEEAN